MNEVEFVVGLLITMGAEVFGEKLDFAAHIKPITDRFHTLDSDGSGFLTPEDIAFMVQHANQARGSAKKTAK